MTSSYSKIFVFVHPHYNDKHALFKETTLWEPFPKSCVLYARKRRWVVDGLNGGKIFVFKNTSICVDGASIEAKIWYSRLVHVWMSVGEYRDCKSKRTICKKVQANSHALEPPTRKSVRLAHWMTIKSANKFQEVLPFGLKNVKTTACLPPISVVWLLVFPLTLRNLKNKWNKSQYTM